MGIEKKDSDLSNDFAVKFWSKEGHERHMFFCFFVFFYLHTFTLGLKTGTLNLMNC